MITLNSLYRKPLPGTVLDYFDTREAVDAIAPPHQRAAHEDKHGNHECRPAERLALLAWRARLSALSAFGGFVFQVRFGQGRILFLILSEVPHQSQSGK